jgi:hypothetical protein
MSEYNQIKKNLAEPPLKIGTTTSIRPNPAKRQQNAMNTNLLRSMSQICARQAGRFGIQEPSDLSET